MAAKVVLQMIVQGTAILGRAVFTAYQQAVRNAKAGPQNIPKTGLKLKMQPDEAMKILNIDKPIPPAITICKETLEKNYKKFYELNDPGKGGSFYLQSKIYRAKEALDQELKVAAAGPDTNSTNSSTSSSGSTSDTSSKVDNKSK